MQGMATTTVEDGPGSKVASSSKKKPKDKSSTVSSLKGSLPNSLFGPTSSNNSNSSSSGVTRMDVSELPSFPQNDRTLSSSSGGSDGKPNNFVTGLKNHSTAPAASEINSSSAGKSSKRKSGSESSNSGGQGSSLTNSTHPTTAEGGSVGRRGLGRGFSSGSSDGEDEGPKHSVFRKTRGVKPPKPPTTAGSIDSDDDEATDSADEGNSGGEERGGGKRRERDGEISTGRQSDRLMSRKDSSESTNSATSPLPNPGHTTSTIFVESTLPKEPLSGGNSLVNMAVGYGAAAESMAPASAVFDKTPSGSAPGTPILDSPNVGGGQRSPGTPIPHSPPSTEPMAEVCLYGCVQCTRNHVLYPYYCIGDISRSFAIV